MLFSHPQTPYPERDLPVPLTLLFLTVVWKVNRRVSDTSAEHTPLFVINMITIHFATLIRFLSVSISCLVLGTLSGKRCGRRHHVTITLAYSFLIVRCWVLNNRFMLHRPDNVAIYPNMLHAQSYNKRIACQRVSPMSAQYLKMLKNVWKFLIIQKPNNFFWKKKFGSCCSYATYIVSIHSSKLRGRDR